MLALKQIEPECTTHSGFFYGVIEKSSEFSIM